MSPASPATGLSSAPVESRGRIGWQIALVLLAGLGQSAIYAIVQIIDLSTRPQSLAQQSTTLNPTLNDRQYFDLTYQVLGLAFALVPVLLACYFVWDARRPHLGRLGIHRFRGFDLGAGLGLALVIGAGGIAVYLAGRTLGLTVNVQATGLNAYWWTIPVLLLSAARAGIQEEFVVLAFLYDRLRALGWRTGWIILGAAVLRGSYHLYQGWGSFVGNLVMGLIFGWLYSRWGRLLPFAIAHVVIDAAVFVGYPWAAATFPGLFG